jgi:hypothetical protein
MILSVSELKRQIDCGSTLDELITMRLKAIEAVIRAYTNNSFQIRSARFAGIAEENRISGTPVAIAVGDTVQISESRFNGGLYVVSEVSETGITVDGLLEPDRVLVTKVKYPADVVQCAVDLYDWKQKNGDKVGIKSETLSRHSVTYEDSATLFMGYPVGILNGLKLHRKARC